MKMKASLSINTLLLSLAFLGIAVSVNTSEEASEHINVVENGNILSYV